MKTLQETFMEEDKLFWSLKNYSLGCLPLNFTIHFGLWSQSFIPQKLYSVAKKPNGQKVRVKVNWFGDNYFIVFYKLTMICILYW